jgi:uncharacterized membrane protein YoaK (UPF0700 family)
MILFMGVGVACGGGLSQFLGLESSWQLCIHNPMILFMGVGVACGGVLSQFWQLATM